MLPETPQHFRGRAAECERLAHQSEIPTARETPLYVAAHWRALADEYERQIVEKQRGQPSSTREEKVMDHLGPSHRSDDQLAAIFDETGHWVVNGQGGRVLCSATSLAQGIERSTAYGMSGATIIAICRLPSDSIIIFPEQAFRLRKFISERGLVSIR